MGPYCRYCDKRCFVERRRPDTGQTLLMATCTAGIAHDRSVTGFDHTTAINPRVVDAQDEPDGAPCCPDPDCNGQPCTFPGYAANH